MWTPGTRAWVIDRCTECRGIWLDGKELEKIQMLVEGWDDALTADLAKYAPALRRVEDEVDEAHEVRISRVGFINAAINGILDLTS